MSAGSPPTTSPGSSSEPTPETNAASITGIRDRILAIMAVLQAEALGVTFLDDPVGFVLAVVLEWFTATVTSIFGQGAYVLLDAARILVERAIIPFGAVILSPFMMVAEGIEVGLTSLHLRILQLAELAGPLGIIVIVLVWIAIGYGSIVLGSLLGRLRERILL